MEDFFAPPAFKPAEALVALRRQLRELRTLTERGQAQQPQFEWRGLQALSLSADDTAILARWVDKPMRSPQWRDKRLSSSADVRHFLEDIKRHLKRWDDEQD